MKYCSCILALVALGMIVLLLAACNTPSPTTPPVSSTPAVTPSQIPASKNPAATATPAAPRPTADMGNSTAVPTLVSPDSAVAIEVEAGSTKQTIAPNQTARVPADSGYIYVLAHFPYPIDHQTTRATLLPPAAMDWAMEMKNPPTADTLAFGLRGSGSGYLTIQIASAQNISPIRFDIQVGNGAPPTPPATPRIVTLANAGQTITLSVGERFLLELGEGFDWTVTVDRPAIVSRVVNVTVVRGAQGLYEAHQPGRATLTATGDPLCRQAQPPCGAPSLTFQIQIVVQ